MGGNQAGDLEFAGSIVQTGLDVKIIAGKIGSNKEARTGKYLASGLATRGKRQGLPLNLPDEKRKRIALTMRPTNANGAGG